MPSERYPALAAWRRELAEGKRTDRTFDPLWRAACHEANAQEFRAAGLPELAKAEMHEARRVIRKALREAA